MQSGNDKEQSVQALLNGERVAGEQAVTGVARVITDISQIDSFLPGEILVTTQTDAKWHSLLNMAKGLVTEARELHSDTTTFVTDNNLPTIVGIYGACQQLATGELITLKLDGSIKKIVDRRENQSSQPTDQHRLSKEPNVADDDTIIQFYRLTADKIAKIKAGTERRAMKDRVSDRRMAHRVTADGELQPDRRSVNRAANIAALGCASN